MRPSARSWTCARSLPPPCHRCHEWVPAAAATATSLSPSSAASAGCRGCIHLRNPNPPPESEAGFPPVSESESESVCGNRFRFGFRIQNLIENSPTAQDIKNASDAHQRRLGGRLARRLGGSGRVRTRYRARSLCACPATCTRRQDNATGASSSVIFPVSCAPPARRGSWRGLPGHRRGHGLARSAIF